jgi:hypothetical protein
MIAEHSDARAIVGNLRRAVGNLGRGKRAAGEEYGQCGAWHHGRREINRIAGY